MKFFLRLSEHLYKIRWIFAGEYKSNYSLDDSDIMNMDIPTFADDKRNLKRDKKAILSDLGKAVDKRMNDET